MEDLSNILTLFLESLKGAHLFHWIVDIILGIFGGIGYHKYAKMRDKKIFENLKKPILFISPSGDPAEEIRTLKDRGFTIELSKSVSIGRARIKEHSLIVYCVKGKDVENFESDFKDISQNKIPIVIYTFGSNNVLNGKFEFMNQTYPWYSVCNTPLRLKADIFSILSV